MAKYPYSRLIGFEAIFNFRDLGGYKTLDGHGVVWRRLFRSGSLHTMTGNDLKRLQEELGLATVIDLRSSLEIEKQGMGLLSGSRIKYFNVSLITDAGDSQVNERRFKGLNNMGEFYIQLARQKEFGKRIIEALKIMADSTNYPLVFHCSEGKDRTGLLAAILLSILKVIEEDIIHDFSLSALYMELLLNRMKREGKIREEARSLPDFFWQASPDLIALFLNALKQQYGSTRGYLKEQGIETPLFDRLEKTLLT